MLNSRFAALCGILPLVTLTLLVGGCSYSDRAYDEGVYLYNQKMYGDAAGAFRNAVRQDPRKYEAHFYLGVCYEQTGQQQLAFQQYWTSLDVLSASWYGKNDKEFRAMILDTIAASIAHGDKHEVELGQALRRAQSKPNAINWLLMAKVYRLRNDADSAIDAYRRAATWDSQNFEIRKEAGLYLLNPLNQKDQAAYYLKQAYRLNPADEAVNTALAGMGELPQPGVTPAPPPTIPTNETVVLPAN